MISHHNSCFKMDNLPVAWHDTARHGKAWHGSVCYDNDNVSGNRNGTGNGSGNVPDNAFGNITCPYLPIPTCILCESFPCLPVFPSNNVDFFH